MDELRTLLRVKADEMHLDPEMPGRLRKRARLRRATSTTLIGMVVLGAAFGSYAGLRAITGDELDRPRLAAEPPGDAPAGEITFERILWIFPDNPQDIQERVDHGQDVSWFDPIEVGRMFAEDVLSWRRDDVVAGIHSDDPLTVLIENSPLAEASGAPTHLGITLEMERWEPEGIYYVRRANSGLLTLSSPKPEIPFSLREAAPTQAFEFEGRLGFVPEDGVISVELRSDVIARAQAPATRVFHLNANGSLRVGGRRLMVVAAAFLRDTSGAILAYTSYPVDFQIPEEELTQAPCQRGGPPAPGVDFQEGPLAVFPEAVSDARTAIGRAAHDRDWKALERLIPGTGFTFSFGGERDPIAHWKMLESDGTPVLDILHTLLCYQGSKHRGVYVWPDAAEKHPSTWTEGDMAPLRKIYSEEELDQIRQSETYYGWRVGIEPDGDWSFFIAGD